MSRHKYRAMILQHLSDTQLSLKNLDIFTSNYRTHNTHTHTHIPTLTHVYVYASFIEDQGELSSNYLSIRPFYRRFQ